MEKILKPLVLSLAITSWIALPVHAEAIKASQAERLNSLQQQLTQLQHEVATLKKDNKNQVKKSSSTHSPISQASSTSQNTTTNAGSQIQGPTDLPASGPLYLPVDLDVPGQSFVSSGPYIGIPLEYSGSNLIINSPSVNEDVSLLQVRKNIAQRLESLGRNPDAAGSHILLSGIVEGQALARNGGGAASSSDIDLTTANLDAYILGPSSWTSALVEFAYDNNIGTQTGSFSSNDRTLNSRVYVNKAFVVIGDLQQSPFYATFGQMYVPFGVYSTTMVSSPITKMLARTKSRALLGGYQQQDVNHLYASTYVFQGTTHASNTSRIDNGGVNIGYGFKMGNVNADIGAGVIANIADSQGMQDTGNNTSTPPLFGGFGGPVETIVDPATGLSTQINTGNEHLVHRVPAYDFHALIGVGQNIQLLGEYIRSATQFSNSDLTYRGDGAAPQALTLEAVYNLAWFVKPTSISIGYGMSREALAIGLPAERYSLVVNRSFWKNTLQSLELRHDVNYSSNSTSSGSSVAGPTGTGKAANTVTLQFDYYF